MMLIRVGGSPEVEVKERKDRVDDSLHATRMTAEEGIVPGGGVALARASLILSKLKADNDAQRFGIEIVRKAIQTPLRQIAENAGEDGAVISGKTLEKDEYNYGFDAQSGEFKDLVNYRSDQGRPYGTAGRGLGRRSGGDHGSDDRRAAGEKRPSDATGWRRNGRHGLLSGSPSRREPGAGRRARSLFCPGGDQLTAKNSLIRYRYHSAMDESVDPTSVRMAFAHNSAWCVNVILASLTQGSLSAQLGVAIVFWLALPRFPPVELRLSGAFKISKGPVVP